MLYYCFQFAFLCFKSRPHFLSLSYIAFKFRKTFFKSCNCLCYISSSFFVSFFFLEVPHFKTPLSLSFYQSHSKLGLTVSSCTYSALVWFIINFIRLTYSMSFKKEVLSFQNLALYCWSAARFVMWSWNDPFCILVICPYWRCYKKWSDSLGKSRAYSELQVSCVAKWIWKFQSLKLSMHLLNPGFQRNCLSLPAIFLWVLARPPFLSLSTSSTRLKSPPTIISSHLKSSSWLKTEVKKFGSSSFGAYIFARVMCFPFVIKSHIINRPLGSV